MKIFRSFSSLLFFAGHAIAICPMALKARSTANDTTTFAEAYAQAHPSAGKRTVGFDPTTQYVSTTGAHAFVAPGSGDARGPCPGLNALANHGYIPHNGIGTTAQFTQATNQVYGMGLDVATFLSAYGTAVDGDIVSLSFSIGQGQSTILGPEDGLTGSHNNYETDVSPTRGDLYEYGDNYDVQLSQFVQLYDLQSSVSDPTQVNYDIPLLTSFRVTRFQQSIDNNPYFFNAAFSGLAVQPAAYQFTFRLMANKSEEFPEGRLDRDTLKSFFAISGPDDNLVYTPGHERIPDNWYKRAIGDEYDFSFFLTELGAIAAANPQFASIGGNTGEADTFTGVDVADLTGGVYDAQTLLQGNNLACFILQVAMMEPSVAAATILLQQLTAVVSPLLSQFDCPELTEIDDSLFDHFPGYTRSS
ncbi:hypothetical protein EV359DRAFT_87413 [Lentinula novae-zelandiae]|nr:hypothetical protein EV359DRAFT_87413 [Lentinula novae-zelandiae]